MNLTLKNANIDQYLFNLKTFFDQAWKVVICLKNIRFSWKVISNTNLVKGTKYFDIIEDN